MRKCILLAELVVLLLWCSIPGVSAGFWWSKTASSKVIVSSHSSNTISSSSSSSSSSSLVGNYSSSEGSSKNSSLRSTILVKQEKGSTYSNTPSLPILHNLKYTVPYSFEECVEDLKQILSTLVGDVGATGATKNRTRARTNGTNEASGEFEYRLSDFANQAIELCSPESFNTIFDSLQNEIGSGKYPQTCILVLDLPGTKQRETPVDPDTDCFQLLIQIEQQLKNKHLLKEKLLATDEKKLKVDPKQFRLQSNRSPSLLEDSEIVKSDDFEDDESYPSPYPQLEVGFNVKHTDPTEVGAKYVTTTVSKTIYKVLNKPAVIHDTVTTTKTIKQPYLVTSLPGHEERELDEPLVNAEHIIRRRTSVMKTTIETTMTTTVTTSQYMLVSKFCHAVSRLGITCPSPPSTIEDPTTTETTTTTKTDTTISTSLTTKTKTKTKSETETDTDTETDTTTETTTKTKSKTKSTTTTSTTIKTKTKTKFTTSTKYKTDCDDDDHDHHYYPPPPPKEPCDDDDHPDYPHHHPYPPPDDDDDCDDDDDDDDDDDFYYFKDSHDYVENYAIQQHFPNGAITTKRIYPSSKLNSTAVTRASFGRHYRNETFRQFKNFSGKYESMENNSPHLLSSVLSSALFALLILVTVF